MHLGDLLDHDELALGFLCGGDAARSRPISGAHSIELENPARWLDRDWVMLTTGTRLEDDADAQRSLVAELDAAGIAALGFGVGFSFDAVPDALLDEASRLGFPVFLVPREIAFRDVVGFVYKGVLSAEVRTFQRLASMQRYLLDAFRDERPQETVLHRLGGLLDASVVLLGADGRVEGSTGRPPSCLAALWPELAVRSTTSTVELDVDGRHALATPVVPLAGGGVRWLVVCARRHAFTNPLTKPAAQAAAPLLAAMARLDDVARRQEEAVRASILDGLLRPVGGREARGLAARAASCGLDFTTEAQVVVLAPRRHATAAPDLGTLREALDARFVRRRLVTVREDGAGLVALVQQQADPLRRACEALVADHPPYVCGIGRAVDAPEAVHHSLRDAELALERAAASAAGVAGFRELDLGSLLVSETPAERLAPKVSDLLGRLGEDPKLHDTLVAYLEHDLDVARTSAALGLHANSLRYRLTRIEKLLGCSLRRPSTIAALYIALTASRLPR